MCGSMQMHGARQPKKPTTTHTLTVLLDRNQPTYYLNEHIVSAKAGRKTPTSTVQHEIKQTASKGIEKIPTKASACESTIFPCDERHVHPTIKISPTMKSLLSRVLEAEHPTVRRDRENRGSTTSRPFYDRQTMKPTDNDRQHHPEDPY